MDKIDFLVKKALSRRSFMAGAGSVVAASVAVGCSDDGTVTLPVTSTSYTDNDILNFALNLEYLEAEFYLRAATGTGLNAADVGSSPGAVTAPGTTKVPGLTSTQQNIVNELAYTEQQHVRLLRSALGSAAISRPAIDLTNGFTSGATAANAQSSTLPTIPSSFSPFASFDSFMVGGFLFEDVGVTAYTGAAPLISTAGITAGLLTAAAGIQAVEAYHGGLLRSYLIGQTITQGTTAYPYALYANRLVLLRSLLSGGTSANLAGGAETALSGFSTTSGTATTVATVPTTGSTVVPVDSNALVYARTTDQVLHVVYGTFAPSSTATSPAAGVSQGGFFPSGLNGNIKTTQA